MFMKRITADDDRPPVSAAYHHSTQAAGWEFPTPKSPPQASNDVAWVSRIDRQHCLSGDAYLHAKRGLDLALVMGSMPLWLPLLAVCFGLVILESPTSPALFRQPRTGKGGLVFGMLKLRTMVPNAAALKKELAHLNELRYPDFKIKNDPRITQIGWLLRKTSLDELPQLINVLRGEMSLVGPRPTSFLRETYAPWHTERLEVTPGLTGLWQVYGRATLEFDDRLRLDILYIRCRCLTLDLRLIYQTVWSLLQRRGAY